MWDEIQANNRRSVFLIAGLGAVLVLVGAVVGLVFAQDPQAAAIGALAAACLWLILWAVAIAEGKSVLLRVAGARKIARADAPQLFNVVEEMAIAAGAKMPEVFIIDSDELNAFAVGYDPERAAVAVTAGLLKKLDRDELQGVIAHELGHVVNRDIRFMTLAGVTMGAIVILADVMWRMVLHSGRGRRSSKGGGQAQAIAIVVALLVAILAPIMAQLLYFACSRRREFLADATGARLTRYPDGLASALEKISGKPGLRNATNRAVAPMYIVNPLQAAGGVAGWFSTHPPTQLRVKILRAMSGGAGYSDYNEAYRKVTAGPGVLGAGFLRGLKDAHVDTRPAAQDQDTRESAVQRKREATDLVDRLAGFALIPCPCGVRIKLPPKYKKRHVPCPRCGSLIKVA